MLYKCYFIEISVVSYSRRTGERSQELGNKGCYGLNCIPLINSYVKAPIPDVNVFENRALKRKFMLNEVVTVSS